MLVVPSLFAKLDAARRAFSAPIARDGYDAAEDRGRRRPARRTTSSEDAHASELRRTILQGTARDLARNWVLLAWAVRKHLDYIADFSFQATTPDKGFNKEFEQWQADVSTRYKFDVAGRHSQRRAVRITEACKTIDGDCGWMKVAPALGNLQRGTIQAIEGDRIAMPNGDVPKGQKAEEWINGVRVDLPTGRAIGYGICDRAGATRRVLNRVVPARNLLLHANYEFRFDQVRGISPIAAGLNFFQDTYEGFDYAFAKLKIGQLFGLAITTKDSTGAFAPPPDNDDDDDDTDEANNDPTTSEPRIQLGRGPFVTELDPGEAAEIVESKTPSTETVEFLKLAILLVLRSLDLDYSFLDSSHTNFYGSRGALVQYLHSADNKVIDLQDHQNEHLRWRSGLAIMDNELILPSGKDFDFLTWEFVPGGVPFWDTVAGYRGAAMGIAAGFTSPQRVCRETNTNFEKNLDEIAEAQQMAEAKGVKLTYADSTAFAPEIQVNKGATDGT